MGSEIKGVYADFLKDINETGVDIGKEAKARLPKIDNSLVWYPESMEQEGGFYNDIL